MSTPDNGNQNNQKQDRTVKAREPVLKKNIKNAEKWELNDL